MSFSSRRLEQRGHSLKSLFWRGTAWVLAGTAISRGLGMIGGIVAARSLGPAGYGELAMLQGTLEMAGFLAGFGLGMVTTKRVSELCHQHPADAGAVIMFALKFSAASGALAALLLCLLAHGIAASLLGNPALGPLLRIASFLVCTQVIQGILSGALSGLQAFRAQAVVLVITGLTRLLSVGAGASSGSLEVVLWGWIIGEPFLLLAQWRSLRSACRKSGVPLSGAPARAEINGLVRIGLPWVLNAATVVPVSWVLRAFLANGPTGYQELGVYGVANQWYNIVIYMPMLLAYVALPIATATHAAGRQPEFWSFLKNVTLARAALALLVAFPAALGSTHLLRVYGGAYAGAKASLYLLLAAGVIDTCNTSFGLFLIPLGRLWGLLCLGIARATVSISACAAFADTAGSLAVCRAILFGALIMFVAGCLYCTVVWKQSSQDNAPRPSPLEVGYS